jgi:hypothetical protein
VQNFLKAALCLQHSVQESTELRALPGQDGHHPALKAVSVVVQPTQSATLLKAVEPATENYLSASNPENRDLLFPRPTPDGQPAQSIVNLMSAYRSPVAQW